ncbi:hypothetical protein VIGAN_04224300 [Vigna angularis var. angularis]|uniref:Uncharacterized protein n=1 Tax=Vigna angularis var. angularis TaxID=157739 RepID=A0A0S3RW03_PHAAN|nr:hypothetical protein VIGAN_04224300 [Vigna angularis var. angularis]
MVSEPWLEPILASSKWTFYSSIPPPIGPLSDHPISNITHEMSIPRREGGVLEVPHRLVYKWMQTSSYKPILWG